MINRLVCTAAGAIALSLSTAAVAQKKGESPAELSTADKIQATQEMGTAAGGMLECIRMAAVLDDAAELAAEAAKVNGFLDKLGNVMTAASVIGHAAKGDGAGLANDAAGVVVSEGGCALAGLYCPVYKVGMGVGTVINYAPQVFGWSDRSLNDMWTDFWVDIIYPDRTPTEAQLQAKIAEMRQRMSAASQAAKKAKDDHNQCVKKQSKSAIDDILEKAKAKADASLSTAIPTDTDLVANTSNAASQAATAQDAIAATQAKEAWQTNQQMNAGRTSSMSSAQTSSAGGGNVTCEATRQQIAEYDRWLAEMGPHRNATSHHAEAYDLAIKARAENQNWLNANCR